MNIFILADNHSKNALYHVDKHVIKMQSEICQMLSNTIRYFVPEDEIPLKSLLLPIKFLNHPCSIWMRESVANFVYSYRLLNALSKEHLYRYEHNRVHKNTRDMNLFFDINSGYWLIDNLYSKMPLQYNTLTDFRICMPDEFKIGNDPILSYRNYYKYGKSHIHSWKHREIPEWIL